MPLPTITINILQKCEDSKMIYPLILNDLAVNHIPIMGQLGEILTDLWKIVAFTMQS